jgi:hypothetical protein
MAYPRGQQVTGLTFTMLNRETGENITSGISGHVTKDKGSQQPLEGVIEHEGNGQLSYNLSADEMLADYNVGVVFTHPDGVTVNFNFKISNSSSSSSSGGGSGLTEGVITTMAQTPKRVRTAEGTVEERSIDDLIKADRYEAGKNAGDAVPWGIRIARSKPGSSIGGDNERR